LYQLQTDPHREKTKDHKGEEAKDYETKNLKIKKDPKLAKNVKNKKT